MISKIQFYLKKTPNNKIKFNNSIKVSFMQMYHYHSALWINNLFHIRLFSINRICKVIMFCSIEQYKIKIKTMSAKSRPTKYVLSSFFRSKCFMTISMSFSCQSTFPSNNNNLHRIDKVQTAFGPCFSRFKRQLKHFCLFSKQLLIWPYHLSRTQFVYAE